MARALNDIITELNSIYSPQKEQYNQQIAAVDPQMQAEQQGLEAAKTDSFNQITTGANRRGLLFSGIPVSEQAKYVGSTYLPSLANLKGRYAQQKFNLTDALNQINTKQYGDAQSIHQNELGLEQKKYEFDRQLEAQRLAQQQLASTFNPPNTTTPTNPNGVLGATSVKPEDQQLYNQMFVKSDGTRWDDQSLVNDYNATMDSAMRGNAGDQRKIQFYHYVKPKLFLGNAPNFPTIIGNTPSALEQAISGSFGYTPTIQDTLSQYRFGQ